MPSTLAGAVADVEAVEVLRCGENLWITAGAAAEIDDAAGKIAAELRGVGIVAVEEGDAIRGEGGDEFEFGARDAGVALLKVLNVRGTDVGDDAPIGRGDAGQRSDLAGVIHSHFDDGDFVLRGEAEELQRQAEVIIQIAFGPEDTKLCGKRGGGGFLGGSFAGRAGDGDDAVAPLATHMRGERLHRCEGIFGDKERMGERGIGQGGCARTRDDGSESSAGES